MCLYPDSLKQAGEVELGGGHLLLDHLEASALQGGLNVLLTVQVGAGGLRDREMRSDMSVIKPIVQAS